MKPSIPRSIKGLSPRRSLRPTSGKVREALFDILRGRVEDRRFLDLYAGTGAVGIEAFRQGAAEVCFVETGKRQSIKIGKSLSRYNFSDKSEIVTKKVPAFVEWADANKLTFDIIFLDPPYHTDEILIALSSIGFSSILTKSTIVIAEHFSKRQLPEQFDKLHKIKDYYYGDSVLSFYETDVGK